MAAKMVPIVAFLNGICYCNWELVQTSVALSAISAQPPRAYTYGFFI